MSGHSKWATIKHKKAATDAKRGKIFTRLIKEIQIAARSGGGDPDGNPRLRTAVAAAKGVSMPADNIKKAIMRGTGELEGGQIDEVMFEGYGPGGAAVLVAVATDNRNRTVSEIRHMFSKNGGNLGEQGSVAWMFERKSQIVVEKDKATEDQLMNILLEAGGDDLRDSGDSWELLSDPASHEAVINALAAAKIETVSAELAMVPKNLMKLEGKNAQGMMKLTEALEEHDDVQNVYSNFDVDEEEVEAAGIVSPKLMRVLGIDCGTERTGYGVIDSDGRIHRMVVAGCIKTSPREPLEARLVSIAGELRAVLRDHRPDAAAVEEVFFAANARSALRLSHVRGVALLIAAEAAVQVAEYSALEIKMSVVGYGRAEKTQVQLMVASLLRLDAPLKSEDASDALAVAICHATPRQSSAKSVPKSIEAEGGRGLTSLATRLALSLIFSRWCSLRRRCFAALLFEIVSCEHSCLRGKSRSNVRARAHTKRMREGRRSGEISNVRRRCDCNTIFRVAEDGLSHPRSAA